MFHRFIVLVACLMTAVAIAAAPAFAGETTTTTTTTTPSAGGPTETTAVTPVSGVSTGAGGTADQGGSTALGIGLGISGVFLILTAGGFMVRRRLAGDSS